MFGSGLGLADFLYAYVGFVIGGGLVLDHHLVPGRNNLAASIGRIMVPPAPNGTNARSVQLLDFASLHSLTRKLDNGKEPLIWSSPQDWSALGPALLQWTDAVADGLAHVALCAANLIDVDNLVIDGSIPANVRKGIAKAVRQKLASALAYRPEPFSVTEGSFGPLGPAIGGASIPLLVKFSNDKELLFKE